MRALFMRHGQTNYNVLGLCNDDPARDVRLTDLGCVQAAAAAEKLAGRPIERILVSRLPRTHETAEIVNRRHRAPITVHAAIDDWRTGLDGRPVAELYRAIAADPLHTRLPGGESLAEHHARIGAFLDWLKGEPQREVLVVAHEETLRAVSARLRGLGPDEMLALRFDNTAILEFEL